MIKSLYRFLNPRFQALFLDYKVSLKPRYGHGKPPHKQLYNIINEHREGYKLLLEKALNYRDRFFEIKKTGLESDMVKPVWNNGYLPGLDIVMLYTLLSELKPQKYVEIGSGNSTKVAYKAMTENNPGMEITSVDPMPRAEIDLLAHTIIRKPFEAIDFSFLSTLNAGDVLFVDNSHRILPNSDATVFFMEVLPALKKGVVVHVHDVYLPYDYPPFMCDRGYSEQYGLAAFLLANPVKYKPLMPNFFVSEDKELNAKMAPLWVHENLQGVETHGGSFWLVVNA